MTTTRGFTPNYTQERECAGGEGPPHLVALEVGDHHARIRSQLQWEGEGTLAGAMRDPPRLARAVL
eukprot:66553-Prorocentrum_minimum.AAC.1